MVQIDALQSSTDLVRACSVAQLTIIFDRDFGMNTSLLHVSVFSTGINIGFARDSESKPIVSCYSSRNY